MPHRWLHGIEASEPDLHLAWREEVNEVVACVQRDGKRRLGVFKTLYDKHPILARERLRGPLREVKAELEKIAKRKQKDAERAEPLKAALLPASGDPIAGELLQLLEREDARLPNATIVLSPVAGGLDGHGMLDSGAPFDTSIRYDVADRRRNRDDEARKPGMDERRRLRVLLVHDGERDNWNARLLGQEAEAAEGLSRKVVAASTYKGAAAMARQYLKLAEKSLLVLDADDEGQPTLVLQLLAESPAIGTAQDDPAAAPAVRSLDDHLADVCAIAERMLARLAPLVRNEAEAQNIAEAIVFAAQWHDRGKNRDPWQADIGNPRRRGNDANWKPLAKSGQRAFVSNLSGRYRHEFGSLREATADEVIKNHPERDLILHLIAAHHGWARPHFRPDQWDIADGVGEEETAEVAAAAMRRFARLQRRFGHWSLAWLEALVRASDYAATERIAKPDLNTAVGARSAPSLPLHEKAG